jgi:hypothetical protein
MKNVNNVKYGFYLYIFTKKGYFICLASTIIKL